MAKLKTRWDNSAFFSGSEDPKIATTVETLQTEIACLSNACKPFADLIGEQPPAAATKYPEIVKQVESIYKQQLTVGRKFRNTSMFIHSCLSINARDAAASAWLPVLQQLGAQLHSAVHPVYGFLARADDALIEQLLKNGTLQELSFTLSQLRLVSDQLLPVEQEQLLTGLAVTGLHGWGNLYKSLAGTLQCTIDNKQTGLAVATNRLSSPDRIIREHAWRSINQAWLEQEQASAAILNNINGWRIEEAEKRAHTRVVHYLDKSCHSSKISRKTLETMMEVTAAHRGVPKRALKTMATTLGVEQLGPWDLMAPAPCGGGGSVEFGTAINTISKSFSQFSKPMGEFVIEMAERGWIDCEPSDNRSTGAYCGSFADPRQPRIFITYDGTMSNVITLAHELGHAWHNRVMENIHEARTQYPMTLAETASIFAETLVRETLMTNATDDNQRLEILWAEASSATALMLNIPARFEFEKRLVDTRKTSYLTPDTLKQKMRESWEMWYGDSLSEYDEMFWASKLHFSISGFGFYNYPYLFGYLFSLGIYAQRENFGAAFEQRYRDILCDTGSMTAEALVKEHFDQDISEPAFWNDSIAIVEASVSQFESLASKIRA